jgi:hypothetical protein
MAYDYEFLLHRMDDAMKETPGPNIALLKWIVITLGILIVVFCTIIGVKLYQQLTKETDMSNDGIPHAKTPVVRRTEKLENLNIQLPAGTRVIQMSVDQGRLYLHVGNTDKPSEILVVDVISGQMLGHIKLTLMADQ